MIRKLLFSTVVAASSLQPAQADVLWMCMSDETEVHPVLILNEGSHWVTAFEKGGTELWKIPFTPPKYLAESKALVRSSDLDKFVFMLIVTEEKTLLFSIYQVSTETAVTWVCQ